MRVSVLCGSIACALLLPGALPAGGKLDTLETEDLRLLFVDATQGYLASHAASCFENSMQFQRELWGYTPSEPVTVLLNDFSDRGNASATGVPRNLLMLELSPLGFDYEAVSANERMNWLMNHELVHIAAADQSAGQDRLFRRFFGGKVMPSPENPETILYFYLTTPRDAAPRWYHEGIAVFVETWMAGGIGRAQGAWDEMVFRSMVRDDARFYDPLGLVAEGTQIDFQVEINSYLYGTRFMTYMAHQNSPEELVEWIARGEGSKKYFTSQFKSVFGLSLKQAWDDWIEWEHEFQRRNLERIREYPLTAYLDLSERALGSVSRAHFDPEERKVYAAFNYPGVVAHIGAISIDDGSVEKIIDIKDSVIYAVTSMTYDRASKSIFYTTDNHEHRDIRTVDPATGKSRTLLKDARIGDLAFNPADRSLWGVRHFNGIATLVRIPHPYEEWNQIHSLPYGEVVYNVSVSPDGTHLSASFGEIDGRHFLRVMRTEDLLNGRFDPVNEAEFGSSIPADFTFSPDGRYLYGSTYYTGVSNIFRYEIATDSLEAVSNCETGFFRPIPLGDDSLIVFRFTGRGFVPARIDARPLQDVNAITFLGRQLVEKHPIVTEWNVGSPAEIPLESLVKRRGTYDSVKSIGLESIYPVVEGYKDYAAYGVRANFSDPMWLNRGSITASYTPNEDLPSDERLHLRLKFERHNWWAGYKRNGADFYDLFGPTKTSRKGYSVSAGWKKTLIYDKPRKMELSLGSSFFGDLEKLPRYQNVAATEDKLLFANAHLAYSNVRASLGHVDGEKGHSWDVVIAGSRVEDDTIPSVFGTFDAGFALPLPHSSIWLRNSAGAAFGEQVDPFANFFFGGFGNNWVDHGPIQRFRAYYAFPGSELNEIGGRNYVKSVLEWNLPPVRFRRIGGPGAYASWLRTALFVGGLGTNLDDDAVRREVGDVGIQLDLRFTVLSRLDMTLSFGAAAAFEKSVAPQDEYMLSLKVLY